MHHKFHENEFGSAQEIGEKEVPIFFNFMFSDIFDWGNIEQSRAFPSFLGSVGLQQVGVSVHSF